jgi:hypothetical protein
MHRIVKDPSTGENIVVPFQTSLPDVTLAAYNETEPGFLRLKVTKTSITSEYWVIRDFHEKSICSFTKTDLNAARETSPCAAFSGRIEASPGMSSLGAYSHTSNPRTTL